MFADVPTLAIAYLDGLAGIVVPVLGRVPNPRPTEFHQVRRVGGPALEPVREIVRLDVFTWAETDVRADELHRPVREAIWALSASTTLGVTCYDVAEFKGPGAIDDDRSEARRVWATYDLTVRADSVVAY